MCLPEGCNFIPKTCTEAYLQQEMCKMVAKNLTGKEKDLAKVTALGHGQSCSVSWHEEGGGEVFLIWDKLVLFEIPQYGGEGRYVGTFDIDDAEKVVDLAHTWT